MKLNVDLEGASLTKRTLIVTGALVGSCVVFVGSLTAVALLVASHAVGPSTASDSDKDTAVPSKSAAPNAPAADKSTAKKSPRPAPI